MAVDKPRAPKRKKLKDNHPLKPQSTINRNKSKKLNSKNPNFVPLGENKFFEDSRVKDKEGKRTSKKATEDSKVETVLLSSLPATQQLGFFLDRFQSANKSKLSPLELEEYKDTCMVELSKDINQDVNNLSKHIKDAIGELWQEVLCDGQLSEGTIEPGSPAVLIISVSALKSLELLRIKKLVDMDALILSRLVMIVLDMRSDAKGYSLLTLPQVSAEFWDLYRVHFNERILQGRTRICFYGSAELRNPKKAISDY